MGPLRSRIRCEIMSAFDEVKFDFTELNNMEQYLCSNIVEAVAEIDACNAYVYECRKVPVVREDLKLAKAALRSAERELRDWIKGIVPPLAEPQRAMGPQSVR